MTNNQRFLAELAVLLLIGGAIYAKATPDKQDEQAVSEIIRAQNFVVADKDGNPLAVLGSVSPPGQFGLKGQLTSLTFMPSKQAKVPVGFLLGVTENRGTVIVMQTNSKPTSSIVMSIDEKGKPSISLSEKGRKERVVKP
jgi:hypothetical protein